MGYDNYWTRLQRRSVSRRTMLRGTAIAGAGLAGAALCYQKTPSAAI